MADFPVLVAPSILAADYGRFNEEAIDVEKKGADWIHCDIMDGHFVDNISFGAGVVKALRPHVRIPLDVHLMITRPDRYYPMFLEAGAASISVHVEAEHDVGKTLWEIRQAGCKVGLAVNPPTSLEAAMPHLDQIDILLLMTVNPGFGGQSFMEEVLPKVEQAAAIRKERGLAYHIEVDGGIKIGTANRSIAAGANVLVAGTSVFGAEDRTVAIRQMRHG